MAKRILAARHYQRRDSAQRKLIDGGRRLLAKQLRDALAHLGTLLPRDHAVRQARAADWDGLKKLVAWGHFREILKAPLGLVVKLRHAGADLGMRKINGAFAQAGRRVRFRKAVGDRFNFDLYDDGTERRIREAQDALIAELDAGARGAIDQIIMNGARLGLSAEDVVDDIRANISLTARQAQAVMNYEDMLRDLDPAALERQLRNVEYDAALQDAIDSGEDLSDLAVARMVDAYRDNFLDFRAETIADTESVRAVNAGIQDAYRQAVDRGALPADAITQRWLVALDERTCPVCLSIPEMNEDGVGINETFQSIDGPQDAPPVHPNCRCSIEVVTDLDRVPDEEAEQAA